MIRNSGNNIKIALLQISPCKTAEENREKGMRYCRKARESGADIALFPEMWNNGYNIYGRPVREWKKDAISVDSDFVTGFGRLAKELNMAIGITLLEKYGDAPAIHWFFLIDLENKNLSMQKYIHATLM